MFTILACDIATSSINKILLIVHWTRYIFSKILKYIYAFPKAPSYQRFTQGYEEIKIEKFPPQYL